MELFLVVFAKSNKQEEFVHWIGGEISELSSEPDLKYFFGQENIVFKFTTNKTFVEVKEHLNDLFNTLDLGYILSIYTTESMSFFFPSEAQKFFTGETSETSDFHNFLQQKLNNLEEVNYELDMSISNLVQELSQLGNQTKSQPKKPTLDELLEKINSQGLSELTKEELNLLDEYSKKL